MPQRKTAKVIRRLNHAFQQREPAALTDTPFGSCAMLNDPHGAVFSIIQQMSEVHVAAQTPEGVLL